MKFYFNYTKNCTTTSLIYRPEEFSFDMEPPQSGEGASLIVNDIQLELNDDGVIIGVWGLSPYTSWIKSFELNPRSIICGEVRVADTSTMKPGIALRLLKERTEVFFDPLSEWIRIGSNISGEYFVEIFTGVVIELNSQNDFVSLWLKPASFPHDFL